MTIEAGRHNCARYNDISVTVTDGEAQKLKIGILSSGLSTAVAVARENCFNRSNSDECVANCPLKKIAQSNR